jgi:hypothetical protein
MPPMSVRTTTTLSFSTTTQSTVFDYNYRKSGDFKSFYSLFDGMLDEMIDSLDPHPTWFSPTRGDDWNIKDEEVRSLIRFQLRSPEEAERQRTKEDRTGKRSEGTVLYYFVTSPNIHIETTVTINKVLPKKKTQKNEPNKHGRICQAPGRTF